jgi:hydroxyacyl-ACP dehydratase HTD2-like protein with hotdog domain
MTLAALPPDGTDVPIVMRTPTAVDLFMFSAAAWLLHRIHYDLPFTTEHDGHPGLLIHGPLQGVYLTQSVERWLGPVVRLRSVNYRHLAPAYLGDSLECGGTVTNSDVATGTIELGLWVRKSDETLTTSGKAVFVSTERIQ